MTEMLIQVLLAVSIIAVLFLIAVLWRSFSVLTDIKLTSGTISKKVAEIGVMIDETVKTIDGFKQTIKGLVDSLKGFSNFKEKLSDFWDDDKKRSKKDK